MSITLTWLDGYKTLLTFIETYQEFTNIYYIMIKSYLLFIIITLFGFVIFQSIYFSSNPQQEESIITTFIINITNLTCNKLSIHKNLCRFWFELLCVIYIYIYTHIIKVVSWFLQHDFERLWRWTDLIFILSLKWQNYSNDFFYFR